MNVLKKFRSGRRVAIQLRDEMMLSYRRYGSFQVRVKCTLESSKAESIQTAFLVGFLTVDNFIEVPEDDGNPYYYWDLSPTDDGILFLEYEML